MSRGQPIFGSVYGYSQTENIPNCYLFMDFGKLPSVDRVVFDLPVEPTPNALLLGQLPSGQEPTIYIGPTGYNMKPWVGKWYPFGSKDSSFLRHYGAQFNTIEHNTTHYRIPDFATVERWYTETPDDFKFCPKIPQSISHARDLGLYHTETTLFCDAIALLKEKLGCCFLQLPPHFGPQDLPLLERFLTRFPKNIPLAVEVRHPVFFNGNGNGEALFAMLEAHQVATVITDVAGRRDVCHMRLTAHHVLIRFVGNDLHPSDYARVQEWASRLKNWFEAGLQAAYFFTHEPDNLQAPELAAFCAEIFKKTMPGVATRGPRMVPGQQGSLFG
jgi:uncharacterized protein YecE (DUF72 family)